MDFYKTLTLKFVNKPYVSNLELSTEKGNLVGREKKCLPGKWSRYVDIPAIFHFDSYEQENKGTTVEKILFS